MVYLTKIKLQKIKEDLKRLKEEKKKIAKILAETKSQGDLSENAGYIAAKEESNNINSKINDLENILREAEIISEAPTGEIGAGSVVVIELLPDKKQITVRLVGWGEISLDKMEISINSPLGKSLIGKKEGEQVLVETPTGKKEYKIIKIK